MTISATPSAGCPHASALSTRWCWRSADGHCRSRSPWSGASPMICRRSASIRLRCWPRSPNCFRTPWRRSALRLPWHAAYWPEPSPRRRPVRHGPHQIDVFNKQYQCYDVSGSRALSAPVSMPSVSPVPVAAGGFVESLVQLGFGPRMRRLHARIGRAHHQAEGMGFSRALLPVRLIHCSWRPWCAPWPPSTPCWSRRGLP